MNSKTHSVFLYTCTSLLILLWAYAAVSKLSDFTQFRNQMLQQVFSSGTAEVLVYILPAIELLVAALLCFSQTRLFGLAASAMLLLTFSIYIALILSNVFGKIPCSCGGILSQLGWGQHLIFNLFFLALALIGWFLTFRKGGEMGKE